MSQATPYLKLSGFYFFYFALLGIMVPYWTLYLKSFGFEAQVIGVLMAILHGSRIFAPYLWGRLADETGQRLKIVRWGAAITWCVFLLIFWQASALGIGLVMLGFSFFWNAVLPQFEVITLGHLGERKHRYSQIRLWGSVGFIITVAGVGVLLDWVSVRWLPWMMLLAMVGIWLSSLWVAEPAQQSVATKGSAGQAFRAVLRQPQVKAFFLICLLVQLGHGAYYTFYSVLMVDLGYTRTEVGALWAIGVIAEVVVFVFMHRMIESWGVRNIMIGSLVLCVVRWLLIALIPDQKLPMLFAQTLHAATFGCLHAVGIALVHQYFSQRSHGQGQAMYSSFGFGVGGSLGALLSGFLWDAAGPQWTFGLSALVSVVAIVLAVIWIYPEKVQQNN
ncbi:MFS transporter [Pontibacter sp. JAM-7]|uniref:MFS transporter n=1 Tax=Pontibacter sp. JAM-7 TaxID=3366581 RepID=UPI003AF816B3